MTQNSRPHRSIFIAVAILGSALQLVGRTPVLEWDPSGDPSVAGYKVYCGEGSRDYMRVVDVGTETSFALTNLDPGLTYYFAITAYAGDLTESGYSDEIYYTSPIDGITAAGKPCGFQTEDGQPKISFYGNAGERYWVQTSVDFSTWERVQSGQLTRDGLFQFTDEPMANHEMKFYRVITSLH